MPEVVDAVVVGGGHNGLVAANRLADAGWDVVVLEAQPEVGGAVRSGEVVRPGFVTDLYSSFYPLSAASPAIRSLRLEEHGLRWRHAPSVVAHPLRDGRAAVLSRDLDATAASVESFAPGDGAAWREVFAEWQRIRDPLLSALFTPIPPVGGALGILRRLGAVQTLRFVRFALTPVTSYGRQQFRGEGAPLLFAGNAMHSDLSPDGAGSALFGWLLCMLGQDVGFPVPEGGSGRLVGAMVSRLERAGGQVRTSSPVARVTMAGGRATGVVLEGGGEIRARKAVLADVSAPMLYERLVGREHLSPRFCRDLDSFEWDDATLKVNWALSGPVPWKAEGCRGAGTVHVGVDMADLTDYSADLKTGRIPQRPFMLFGQTTTADPTRSPVGTESTWSYTHLPRRHPLDDAALDRHVERMEDTLEEYAPGFRDLVLDRGVQRPRDLQGHDASLDMGAVNAGSSNPSQLLVLRPTPGLGRPETPVEGLFLASASAHPGGGVHGAPGWNAARAALLRDSRLGSVAAKGFLAATRYLTGGLASS
ncbi:phytoene dehydrogenase-like protein [Motilibacter rhizosphaerae]|uniref:Pyridine nucleotide-disulfide oxidoreductase domain-containing protein 2 n=1 Tax=Motilibacter rhizosphaerae TaxID=598652 RepID=A0A4Q7NWX8_9ACTN|nr:NAD(P)/FAD-dependent oxidoreductase [Motilibacter rhizosphaerae]RZS91745.1 phytoene dehydrogenase-like protein [Motilibacter rhizosphaerae]